MKFHSSTAFKPTRDFNADDVLFSFNRQWKADHPYDKVSGGKYDYFDDMDMPKLLKSDREGRRLHGRMKLNEPNAPILANLAMDFASIHSAEYADFLLKAGKPEQFDQVPVGTGPFSFVAYQKDAVIRFKANPDYWGGKAAVDDLVFAITPDPTARYAKLKTANATSMLAPARPTWPRCRRTRRQGDQPAGPQHRLLGVQRPRSRPSTRRRCARPSTWRSTRRRSSRTSTWAPARRRRT